MTRMTISLSSTTHRVLKEAATHQGRSMASIIEENLQHSGIGREESAREIVARIGSKSRLSPEKAMDLAVEETRLVRRGS